LRRSFRLRKKFWKRKTQSLEQKFSRQKVCKKISGANQKTPRRNAQNLKFNPTVQNTKIKPTLRKKFRSVGLFIV